MSDDAASKEQEIFELLGHSRCVQRSTGQDFIASKLAYYITRLANQLAQCDSKVRRYSPEVGDIVCEISHTIMFGSKELANDLSVGELISIKQGEHGYDHERVFTVRGLNGKEMQWTNAFMCVVLKNPNPSTHPASPRPVGSPRGL